MEEWRWIIYKQHDFTGKYMVSDQGRIKSVDRHTEKQHQFYKGRILKQRKTAKRGNTRYMAVTLWDDGKQVDVEVHRIVATTFVDNPHGKKYVNHKDGNGENNRADNLEWCTAKENVQHSIDFLGNNPKKWKAKAVEQRTVDGELLKVWESAWQIQRELGYCQVSISRCCRGIKKDGTMYGYRWKFKEGGD